MSWTCCGVGVDSAAGPVAGWVGYCDDDGGGFSVRNKSHICADVDTNNNNNNRRFDLEPGGSGVDGVDDEDVVSSGDSDSAVDVHMHMVCVFGLQAYVSVGHVCSIQYIVPDHSYRVR